MKVAIVGHCPDSRELIPFGDPEWEIWGLNQVYAEIDLPRWDRWFEMHTREIFHSTPRNANHLEWLREQARPIYMQQVHADIPASRAYPIKQALNHFGPRFGSSVPYAFALAIMEHAESIGLWGVDMGHRTEYGLQRPNMFYWIGLYVGLGGHLVLPSTSALCEPSICYGYDPEILRAALAA